jgi:hypothetical protein
VAPDVSTGSVWPQQTELAASQGGPGRWFGYPVSISGTTALIGAWGPPTAISVASSADSPGAVYVFTESGGTWSPRAELTASDGDSGDLFGYSVSISGTTALIGAPGRGVAYVFTRSGATWTQRAELAPFDASAGYDYFGYSVSLSGTTAVVGAPGANSDQGVAYVFSGSGGNWSHPAKLTAADAVLKLAVIGALGGQEAREQHARKNVTTEGVISCHLHDGGTIRNGVNDDR